MLNLLHLDQRTRKLMLEEIARDAAQGSLYLSPRLSPQGRKDYQDLLEDATRGHDEEWLANQLRLAGRLNQTEMRGSRSVRVPVTAAETLAEGEFNRFYIRALCLRASEDGVPHLIVYRAKQVENPRPASQARLDSEIDSAQLLADLRGNAGVDTALGVPAGPNSGLSVRLPTPT
jgi:hypothetical protein